MDLLPTVGQKIKNLLSKFNKQCLSFMLRENYDNANQRMKLSKVYHCNSQIKQNFSESKMAAVRRSLCLMLTVFT